MVVWHKESCPLIQIKYVDTKHQLADFWQKRISHVMSGAIFFTSFNISHFSSLCWAQNFNLTSCTRTQGRRQQDGGTADDDERVLLCLDKFYDCEQSDCVEKPGDTQSTLSKRLVKYRETLRKRSQSPSSSRGCVDVSTRKLVAIEDSQEQVKYLEDSASTGKLVAPGNPRNPGDSGTRGNDEDWPHNLHISTHDVMHMEKVFPIVRRRYGRSPTDQMEDFDVNTAK